MKKVGIIGGAGPLASALIYETIVRESYLQAYPLPEIFLINYPFTKALSIEQGRQNDRHVREELGDCIRMLAQQNVQMGILACNTLHLYLPEASMPFLHLPRLVMNEAKQNGHRRLLILGTPNTCRSQLYRDDRIEMCYPSAPHQQAIDQVIEHVLEGKIYQEDARVVSVLIEELAQEMEFDGVVLGCTDLPVLHHHFPIQSAKTLYDSIKLPAKRLRGYL